MVSLCTSKPRTSTAKIPVNKNFTAPLQSDDTIITYVVHVMWGMTVKYIKNVREYSTQTSSAKTQNLTS
jgi:hypothetical protein